MGVFILFKFLGYGEHYSAFHTFFEELTAVFVNSRDRSRRVIRIRRTAARAVESRPAVAAFLARIDVAVCKLTLTLGVRHTVVDVSELELFVTNKLVAGIEISQGVTAIYSVPEPQPEMRL